MAEPSEKSSNSCPIKEGHSDCQSGEQRIYEELKFRKDKNTRPARLVNVLFVISTVTSVAALVLASISLSKTLQSTEVEDLKRQIAELNEETITLRLLIGNSSTSMGRSVNSTIAALSHYEKAGWIRFRNLYYKYFEDDEVNYRSATQKCEDQGGRLAAKVLRDPVAVRDITARFCPGSNSIPIYRLWIGYDDIKMEGDWQWSDGGTTNRDTTEWNDAPRSPKEPNGGTKENCAHIWEVSRHGKLLLNDAPCSGLKYYICEIEMTDSDASTGL